MNKSDTIEKLAAALAKAQPSIRHATKDNSNNAYKDQSTGKASRYADLTSYIAASRDALSANGLSIVQIPSADGAKVTVTTVLMHDCGQWISGELTMTAAVATPQGIGGAITYARRYALAAMLNMGADDDDGNLASGKGSQGHEQQQEQRHEQQTQSGMHRTTTKSAGTQKESSGTQKKLETDAPPSGESTLTPPQRFEIVCEEICRVKGEVHGNKFIATIRAKHGADKPNATVDQKMAALLELEHVVTTAVAVL